MALIYAPRPQTGLTQPPPQWEFPVELATEPMPLQAGRGGLVRARWRTIRRAAAALSMARPHRLYDLDSRATRGRAQHRPERCFEVYGLSLEESRTGLDLA